MQIELSSEPLPGTGADVSVVGLLAGAELPEGLREAPGAGGAGGGYKKLATLWPPDRGPVIVVGLGDGGELDPERLRVAAALAVKEAARHEARRLCWVPPAGTGLDELAVASALVDGTILASYRFDRFRSHDADDPPAPAIETLVLAEVDEEAVRLCVEPARVAAEAANRARDLQSLPANLLNPEALADRAREIAAAHAAVSVEVLGREQIEAAGMGGLAAVAKGSDAEPRLIALRYRGGGPETIGVVGKGVTFDSGGISIKPAAGMQEMKMDMSGAAAVIEAFAAIAELGLALDLVAVIPATENMLNGGSMRPGDIITQLNGKTVEVNNTDAEGRLILADALTYCVREMGAARVIDLATLTGAVVVALGSTYAALISNDDDWAARVGEASESTGELAWRLPLHAEYKELTKGKIADLTNAASKRKAGTIYAASFLEEFVDGVPWVHLDIAGTSWDVGREYVGSGPTGFGVRLLVALARELATARAA